MSDGLKTGWRRVKFGEVVRQVKDRVDPETAGLARYIAGEHMDTDDLKVRRWGDIGADYLGPAFHMRFKPGQVLYGSRRTYLRKVAIADFEGITANTTFVLEPKDPNELLPELLPFLMQTERFHEHSVKQSRGSVNPYVNFSDLAWYELALPPLEEQRRLLAVLLRCEDQIEDLRSAKSRADTAHLALNDHFVADWIQRFPVSKLADALLLTPESGCSAPESATETGHWVLSLSALAREGYVEGQIKPVQRTEKMISAELTSGDLLISRSNTFERVGFVGIYTPEGDEPVSFPDTMMRLKPDPALFDAMAFELILQSTPFRRQVGSIAAGTSASMKKINKTNLLNLFVPRPSKDAQNLALEARRTVIASRTEVQTRLKDTLAVKAKLANEALSRN